jgi:hypothetical protein
LKEISAGEKRLLDALFVGGVTAESIKARIEDAHARRTVCSRANYPGSLSLWISRAALISCASMRRISGA